MRVLEASSIRMPSEATDRSESPSPDDTNKTNEERTSGSAEDDAQPSTSSGSTESASPFHLSSLTSPASAQVSLRSELWPNVSSEALMVSLDEPSESSSSQSSPSPTTCTPSTSSSTTCADSSRVSSGARNTNEDPVAVQRRYRYIRSRIPVRGHSFCSCLDSPNRAEGRFLECLCGEENGSICEWTWDAEFKSVAAKIQDDCRTIIFHPNFSNGTAAVRGSAPMREGQHFWEVKMITPVYGTNMMVGVGTKDINLEGYSNVFCSLLGQNTDSWGLSYQAHFHHAGQIWQYGGMFGQGSLLGIHLDCWNGTLSFYKNRRPLGVACRNLTGKEVYPMLCSTAARSGMRLVRTQSCASTLQYLCCRKIRQLIPSHLDAIHELPLPPGLKTYLGGAYGWLLSSTTEPTKPPQDEKEENNPQATDADLEAGSSTLDASSSYQVLSDRDIIFERFVERLSSSGQVLPSVHDAAVPGTSQQGDQEQQSPSAISGGQFEMVPDSASSGKVNPAVVSDSEDITDVSVLSPQSLIAETGREQVEASSWICSADSTKPGTSNPDSNRDPQSDTLAPFLKRTLRRKRTIASLSEISQAAVNLHAQLDECDPDTVTSEFPKRQKLQEMEQKSSSSATIATAKSKVVTFTHDAMDEEVKKSTALLPSTPFSTFCSTNSACRPFTPPNGTSTPVTNLSPEDANGSLSNAASEQYGSYTQNANPEENAEKDNGDL